MRVYILTYVFALISFLGMDAVWLGLASSKIYKANLGPLLLEKPNFAVGGLFYAVYAIGIVVFAVLPALEQQSYVRALGNGALLGLLAYGAYDFTNQATIAGWSTTVTIVDLTWGIIATAIASMVSYFLMRLVG